MTCLTRPRQWFSGAMGSLHPLMNRSMRRETRHEALGEMRRGLHSMSAPVLAEAPSSRTATAVPYAVLPICVGAVLLGLIFNQEVVAAVQTWNDSTAYNHCYLIIPIALYLLWDRKQELAAIAPAPMPVAVLLAIPVGVVWLVADR